jgi:hypothetical protein
LCSEKCDARKMEINDGYAAKLPVVQIYNNRISIVRRCAFFAVVNLIDHAVLFEVMLVAAKFMNRLGLRISRVGKTSNVFEGRPRTCVRLCVDPIVSTFDFTIPAISTHIPSCNEPTWSSGLSF